MISNWKCVCAAFFCTVVRKLNPIHTVNKMQNEGDIKPQIALYEH